MFERPRFILISSYNICFGYLLESPQHPKHMLPEDFMQRFFA